MPHFQKKSSHRLRIPLQPFSGIRSEGDGRAGEARGTGEGDGRAEEDREQRGEGTGEWKRQGTSEWKRRENGRAGEARETGERERGASGRGDWEDGVWARHVRWVKVRWGGWIGRGR